ncbi:DUF4350 domain-containing protein [Catellatospora sichuanensis]|uniref:DUF4350 domain-containing protein n=1 Tax=Catellatospora sichuanensis TaxID=1969805 RepID=UPI001184377E|nr:DUF4350 domain-containing protein [Catellatospora sichuanensis]
MTTRTQRRRRWRLVLPILPVLALIVYSVSVHMIEEPSPSEPAYLAPAGDGPDGAAGLAEQLRARGVTIRTFTDSDEAFRALGPTRGDTTLFVPSPGFLYRGQLGWLRWLPDRVRVVLVEPDAAQVAEAVESVGTSGRRWATGVAARGADCRLTDAGPAAVVRTRYGQLEDATAAVESCYDGGLVRVYEHGKEFVLVGSADPFRAERAGEHDNAGLALDLLSAKSTLVWLDLHEREPVPPKPSKPPVAEDDYDDYVPPSGNEAKSATGPSPFPDWLFWVVLTLLAATLTVMLARGRRLGPPVPEALPVVVPGAETAAGRGRLYRRARARGPALETLRAAARRRLAAALNLPATAGPEALLPALQARTGDHPQRLGEILYGPPPQTDDELHDRAVQLRHLVEYVTARPVNEGEPR